MSFQHLPSRVFVRIVSIHFKLSMIMGNTSLKLLVTDYGLYDLTQLGQYSDRVMPIKKIQVLSDEWFLKQDICIHMHIFSFKPMRYVPSYLYIPSFPRVSFMLGLGAYIQILFPFLNFNINHRVLL